MKLKLYLISLLLLVCSVSSSLAAITCPPMPTSVTDVNHDVRSDIKASAASLGKVKAGEIAAKTETTAKNLFDKYPNVDKLLAMQTMAATYCAMLRDATSLSEKEKIDRWENFQEKVLNLQRSQPPKQVDQKVISSKTLQKQIVKKATISPSTKKKDNISTGNISRPSNFRISIMSAERCIIEWTPKESDMTEEKLSSYGVDMPAVKSAIKKITAVTLKRDPVKVSIMAGESSTVMPGAAYRISSLGVNDARYDTFHIYVREKNITISLFRSGDYALKITPEDIGIDWKEFQKAVGQALKKLYQNVYEIEFDKVRVETYNTGEWNFVINYFLHPV